MFRTNSNDDDDLDGFARFVALLNRFAIKTSLVSISKIIEYGFVHLRFFFFIILKRNICELELLFSIYDSVKLISNHLY